MANLETYERDLYLALSAFAKFSKKESNSGEVKNWISPFFWHLDTGRRFFGAGGGGHRNFSGNLDSFNVGVVEPEFEPSSVSPFALLVDTHLKGAHMVIPEITHVFPSIISPST